MLAAIQLEAIANAEGVLAVPAEAHEQAYKAAAMAASFDWCGFFAMENYMLSNLDSDLKRGYFHVTNVEHYFTYRYALRRAQAHAGHEVDLRRGLLARPAAPTTRPAARCGPGSNAADDRGAATRPTSAPATSC